MSKHSFPLSQQIFLPSALHLCRDINYCVTTFFLWFFSTFVTTIFYFVATKFLTTACCCYCDIKLLCRYIVLLSRTVESKLYVTTEFGNVVTDFENVSTHFLHLSLLLAELFVATLKSLSQPNYLDLSHCFSNFCRGIIFFCHDRYFSLYSSLCRDLNLIVKTKLYCYLLDHCRDKAK